MKRDSLLLIVIFLALAPLCPAQDKGERPEPDASSPEGKKSVEQIILNREKQGWDAIVKADGVAFKSVHTDDALIASPDGMARISQLAPALATLNILEYSMSETRVIWPNDSTAILIYKALLREKRGDDHIATGTYYHSSTWVKSGGKWLSAFHQVTALPPAR